MSTHELNSIAPSLDNRIGEMIAQLLIQRIGRERFEMWFTAENCFREELPKAGNAVGCENSSIIVLADNTFALGRIKTTFGSELRNIVDQICGIHYEITYKLTRSKVKSSGVDQAENLEHLGEPNRSANFQMPLPLEDDLDPKASLSPEHLPPAQVTSANYAKPQKKSRSLKTFCFGHENRLAEASVDQLFDLPGQFSPFFLYGPTGSGKTHLLEAIVHEFRQKLRCKRCVMLSSEQFTSLFVSSLRGGEGLPMFRRKYRDLDLLVIDDIQFLAGKKATVNEFYYTIENMVRSGRQVILSADRPAVELGLLGGDFGNRLSAGLSCPIRYSGVASRIEIAKRFCSERKIQLTPPVLELICDRLPGDIRRISGAVNRLHAYRLSTGQPISLEIAENELSDLFAVHRSQGVSLVRIESAVCELCGIKPAELKSNSRHKSISTARMLAMYLSRQHTSSAFSEIGEYFGGRSHSTVIAAQKKVSQWLERNEGVSLPMATYRAKEVISRLESNLRIG